MSDTEPQKNAPDAADDGTSEMRFGAGETAWLAVVTVLAVLGVALGVIAVIMAGSDDGGGTGGGGGAATAELSPEAVKGQDLADQNGCVTCHSADGSDSVGPTWQGVAGSEVTLDDGTTVTADEAYLEASITDPSGQIVEGFTTVAMPQFDLSSEDVAALVAYIDSLGGTAG